MCVTPIGCNARLLAILPTCCRNRTKVLFPGVGEASSAMKYLQEHGLDRVIVDLTQPGVGYLHRIAAFMQTLRRRRC